MKPIFASVDLKTSYGGFGGSLGDLVGLIFNAGIVVAGIIVVFLFIFGGLGVIQGAGNNDPKAAAQGKQALTYALLGFVIVFSAYWIVRIFEVISGTNFLTSPLTT